jgi:signal transduction histidine kinase
VRVHDDLEPAWTTGEPALLERMVANLLDNGIHHNEPGGFLDVSARMQGGRVLLRVGNGGPLIEPADAQQLTQPFRRLDRSGGGFGLGLSIVRSVAEAHGGIVEVSARRGGGLEVLVSLPALELAPRPTATRSAQALARR